MRSATSSQDYVAKISAIVATMPPDRAREVFDYVVTLQSRIEAQDEEVDATFDDLLLSDEGQQAFHDLLKSSGPALPMFDENGKWLVDDYVLAKLEA